MTAEPVPEAVINAFALVTRGQGDRISRQDGEHRCGAGAGPKPLHGSG